MNIKQKILFIVLIVTSINSYGATQLLPQKINSIDTGWGKEGIYFSTVEKYQAEGCSEDGIVLQNDHPYFNQVLALVISAMHSNKSVGFRIYDCNSGGYMILNAIQVYK